MVRNLQKQRETSLLSHCLSITAEKNIAYSLTAKWLNYHKPRNTILVDVTSYDLNVIQNNKLS